eukprot:3167759-Amphidinium_carterae.3
MSSGLPEVIYTHVRDTRAGLRGDSEVCRNVLRLQPRPRIGGIRGGDVVFMDHAEVKEMRSALDDDHDESCPEGQRQGTLS